MRGFPLILAALVLQLAAPAELATDDKYSLVGCGSFAVRSRVRHWMYTNPDESDSLKRTSVKFRSEFQEIYSNEQRRATIHFDAQTITSAAHTSSLTKRVGRLHVDRSESSSQLALVESVDDQRRSTIQAIDESVIKEELRFDFFDIRLDELEIPSHVVGPARLLFFVEQNKSHLKFAALETPSAKTEFPSIRYTLTGQSEFWGNFSCQVFYREQPEDPSNAGARRDEIFPDRVTVVKEDGSFVTVDYTQVRLDVSSLGLTHLPGQRAAADDVIPDAFMLEPSVGVFEALDSRVRPAKPLTWVHRLTSFAFKAELRYSCSDQATVELNQFVAYDSGVASLRVDSSASEWRIMNLRYNRLYDIRSTLSEVDERRPERLNIENPGSRSPKADCVISKIESVNHRSIEQLLFGASKFVYLGRAQVRGIDARVYETQLAGRLQLPVWLKAPLQAPDTADHSERFSMVLYLSETEDDPAPLLLEISTFSESNGLVTTNPYASIHLREFVWNFDSVFGQSGDQVNVLFSLTGLCSQATNAQAEVKVLLHPNQFNMPTAKLLRESPAKGDLSLLSALQSSLGIPVTLIDDLEIKLLQSENSSVSIAAAFRMIDHDQTLMKFAEILKVTMVSYRDAIKVSGVNECFLRAAHYGEEVVFGYDPATCNCYLKSNAMSMTRGSVRVFKTSRERDSSGELATVNKLKTKSIQTSGNIVGAPMSLQIFGEYKLSRIEVDIRENKHNSEVGVNRHKVSGLKLPEADERNDKIDSASYRDENKERPMSLDRCRTICASDLNCNSYSVCLKNSRFHCTISSVMFNMEDLTHLIGESPKIGQKIKVSVQNSANEMELESQFNCDLFNKDYLSYFEEPVTVSFSFAGREPKPTTSGREGCAKECTLHQFDLVKRDASRAKRLNSFVLETIGQLGFDDDEARRDRVPCLRFFYLDKSKLTEENSAIVTADDSTIGYCVFEHHPTVSPGNQEPTAKLKGYIESDMFKFRMDSLYEEQYGVALRASIKTDDESEAYEKIHDMKPDASEYMSKIRSFVARSGNSQTIVPSLDRQACATMCFLQRQSPWPACKSFDIKQTMGTKSSLYTCHMNSITLLEAMNQMDTAGLGGNASMILESEAGKTRVWHYEPIMEFVNYDDNRIFSRNDWLSRDLFSLHFVRSFARLLGILLAISVGCLIGRWARQELVPRALLVSRRESTENIVTQMQDLSRNDE